MSFRFKLTDFVDPGSYAVLDAITAVDTANRLLSEHLATLPEVFSLSASNHIWEQESGEFDSYRARLWGIEEIVSKKCEHKQIQCNERWQGDEFQWQEFQCRKCGKRLVAKWEEA